MDAEVKIGNRIDELEDIYFSHVHLKGSSEFWTEALMLMDEEIKVFKGILNRLENRLTNPSVRRTLEKAPLESLAEKVILHMDSAASPKSIRTAEKMLKEAKETLTVLKVI